MLSQKSWDDSCVTSYHNYPTLRAPLHPSVLWQLLPHRPTLTVPLFHYSPSITSSPCNTNAIHSKKNREGQKLPASWKLLLQRKWSQQTKWGSEETAIKDIFIYIYRDQLRLQIHVNCWLFLPLLCVAIIVLLLNSCSSKSKNILHSWAQQKNGFYTQSNSIILLILSVGRGCHVNDSSAVEVWPLLFTGSNKPRLQKCWI